MTVCPAANACSRSRTAVAPVASISPICALQNAAGGPAPEMHLPYEIFTIFCMDQNFGKEIQSMVTIGLRNVRAKAAAAEAATPGAGGGGSDGGGGGGG